MSRPSARYEQDFSAWALEQAEALCVRPAMSSCRPVAAGRTAVSPATAGLGQSRRGDRGVGQEETAARAGQPNHDDHRASRQAAMSARRATATCRLDRHGRTLSARRWRTSCATAHPLRREVRNQLWPVAPALRSVVPAAQLSRHGEKLQAEDRGTSVVQTTRLNRSWATGCRRPRPPPRTAAAAVAGAA